MATSSNCLPVVPLSKIQTLGLLTELLAGFASGDFQQQLRELAENNTERSGNDLRCVEGRLSLTLAVQKQVLPRYGFAGDEDGVLAMKMAVRKHMGDPRVAQKSMAIRNKLLLPELQKETPAAKSSEVAQTPVPEASIQSLPTQAPQKPTRTSTVPGQVLVGKAESGKAIKKGHEMEVMVQHTKGQGQLSVKVIAEGATMLHVKQAVVEKLGRGTVADVQLVMWGGGMFVNHRDCDDISSDRVFATGMDLRGVN